MAGNHKLNADMFNALIDPNKASELSASVLPSLRHILYTGIHGLYWCTVITVILALIANYFDHDGQLTA
ncbi:hypothetical protein LM010_14150 [Lacticaseibacillus manihotivorans]|uniref:Uncharacterized protein n=1 Tax=Lacticaseibacillus manihotivorans TaxID=88233 RepID=A0A5P8JTU8_9LACO|nr:hypothetical protein [Lacticaseibacillus manihotivorans]QFQ92488.1 hypothetical protein LM010_14150 [Lacticaseibacillus manihotivorans]